MVATVFMLFLMVFRQKSKVRLISESSEFSYLALGQIRKLGNLGKIFLCFKNDLNFISVICNGKNCFHAFLNSISEQKSKVRLISKIPEFSYLALGQIRKLGKVFLSFRNDLNFKIYYDLQW